MNIMRNILMHMFGRAKGVLGRLGGLIMAHTNENCGAWVVDLLEIGQNDSVLEVGFGPGVIIQRLSKLASAGHIAGIDLSQEMVEQAQGNKSVALAHYQFGFVLLEEGINKHKDELFSRAHDEMSKALAAAPNFFTLFKALRRRWLQTERIGQPRGGGHRSLGAASDACGRESRTQDRARRHQRQIARSAARGSASRSPTVRTTDKIASVSASSK